MTAVTRPAVDLHQQITEALAEVKGARAAQEHCPSSDAKQIVEYAEWRLNRLLDRLPREKETRA